MYPLNKKAYYYYYYYYILEYYSPLASINMFGKVLP